MQQKNELSQCYPKNNLTARDLLYSGLAGIWKDRKNIKSTAYTRQLREQAQNRRR